MNKANSGRQGFLPGLEAPWEADPADAAHRPAPPAEAVQRSLEGMANAPAFGPSLLPDNRLTKPLATVLREAPPTWAPLVSAFAASDAGRALIAHVDARREAGLEIYPDAPLRALPVDGPASVRVVIVGQDPYHGPGEAEGLAFSVRNGVRIPPSLRNLLKELAADLPACFPAAPATAGASKHLRRAVPQGSLLAWVEQGVLLLNTSLTVERDSAGSHAKRGWEGLTDAIVDAVARDAAPKVFMLWGAHAQAKAALVAAVGAGRHLVLASNHPSPLAASRPPVPFLGSHPFSQANAWLAAVGRMPIDWSLAS
jgi:uracil-DNA glycosylase